VSSPYVVNVSSVQDFYQCRYRWYCKWVLNRVPRHEGPALEAGKLLHNIFEDHFLKDVSLHEAAIGRIVETGFRAAAADDPERATLVKATMLIEDLREALPLWQDVYPMTIPNLETEEPFEITFPECPGVVFRGRPDRVSLLDDGHIYHVQNRGLASNMNFAQYIRLARRHYHEHLYAEHLARKYADLGPYGGTLFNLIRKLKFRTNVGKKNEKTKTAGEMFWQFPMSIDLDSQQHRDVMASLFEHVDEMQWLERKAKFSKGLWLPAANEKMNGGYNGTTEDAFFKVLMREISLDDNEYFKDREDTYAVADVDAGQD